MEILAFLKIKKKEFWHLCAIEIPAFSELWLEVGGECVHPPSSKLLEVKNSVSLPEVVQQERKSCDSERI